MTLGRKLGVEADVIDLVPSHGCNNSNEADASCGEAPILTNRTRRRRWRPKSSHISLMHASGVLLTPEY